MANRVRCPNCGTEFDIHNEKEWNGYHKCDLPDMDMCVGTLIPSEKSNKSTAVKGEKTMAGTNEMKGTSMEEWVREVINSQRAMTEAIAKIAQNNVPVSSANVGGEMSEKEKEERYGKFGKASKRYGTEVCGFMWDPYLESRWLQGKFKDWMKVYDLNIDLAIKNEVDIMESIKFCIEECERLSHMSDVELEVRKMFWSVDDMKTIFLKYWKLVQKEIDEAINDGLEYYKEHKRLEYIKYHGGKHECSVNIDVKNNNTNYVGVVTSVVFKDWKLPEEIKYVVSKIEKATTYEELFKIMSVQKLVKLQNAYIRKWGDHISYLKYNPEHMDNRICEEFINGYKKKGAYFTMDHDIKYEGLEVNGFKDKNAIYYIMSLLPLQGYEIYKVYKIAKGYSKIPGRN